MSSNFKNAITRKDKLNREGVKYIFREFVSTIINLILLLFSAGTLIWINAWVCTGLILAYQSANIILLYKMNPSLLNKRGKIIQQTTKVFDKIFVVIFLLLAYTIPVVAGLDAVRYQWSAMSVGLIFLGGIFLGLSFLLGIWAMMVNTNFEMTVFIKEGAHQVCLVGPYKFIRHPGYAAEIMALMGVVLVLGSWWAFVPGGALAFVFIVRTYLEDKTLQNQLPGYLDYTKHTRFRLIPFIW